MMTLVSLCCPATEFPVEHKAIHTPGLVLLLRHMIIVRSQRTCMPKGKTKEMTKLDIVCNKMSELRGAI